MGTQNLNNFYFNKLDSKLNYSEYYDLFLASDEKDFNTHVVWSNKITGYNDGDTLPVWIDLSDPTCGTQPITSCPFQYIPSTAATIGDYYTNNNYRPFSILSKNYWPQYKSCCDCPYSGAGHSGIGGANTGYYEISDIIWTGLDNGLLNLAQMDPYNTHLTVFCDYAGAALSSPWMFDRRFKMNQVKSFRNPIGNPYSFYTDTSIINASDSSGYYQKLKGGFYQGFYKLYGYPYEVLPTRPNKGWSFETYLKLTTITNSVCDGFNSLCCVNPPVGDQEIICGSDGNCYNASGWGLYQYNSTATTYNFGSATTVCSPLGMNNMPVHLLNYSQATQAGYTIMDTNNGGFFFYKGLRAEDKYQNRGGQTADTQLDVLSACTTLTGITGCCNTEEETVKLTNQNKSPNPEYDVYSNAFGVRLTDDMKIGYRTIRYTGECRTTGETCETGMTFWCDYVIEESYSEPICDFIIKSGNCVDTWIQVDVVFERNLYLEECEIFNNGGVNDLVKVRTDKFQRYGTHKESSSPYGCNPSPPTPEVTPCKDQYPRFIEDAYFDFNCHGAQVQSWFNERESRLGTLTFYVNGRRVHKVENYEEIIPRQLNTNKQTQVGVAYNMSWGGGALGLRESLIQQKAPPGDPCIIDNTTNFINLDLTPDRRLISDNFGGSFIGGISQMMYYIKPLTADEIYHNFTLNRDRYGLIDCEECKDCNNGCIDCDLPSQEDVLEPDYPSPESGSTGGTLVLLVACDCSSAGTAAGIGTYQCVNFDASVGDVFSGNPFTWPTTIFGSGPSGYNAWSTYNKHWMVAVTGGACVWDPTNPVLNIGQSQWQNAGSTTYSMPSTNINGFHCPQCCNELTYPCGGWGNQWNGGMWNGAVPNPETGACWDACP
tara:strand:- start:782 stop:3430 length:2649 start_codon:yes stop_codon:yes gene_type:complete